MRLSPLFMSCGQSPQVDLAAMAPLLPREGLSRNLCSGAEGRRGGHALPSSYASVCLSSSGFPSCEGGVIIAARRTLVARVDDVSVTVIRRVRILAVRLAVAQCCQCASGSCSRRSGSSCMFVGSAGLHRCAPGEPVSLGGDWNFLHLDDSKLRDGRRRCEPSEMRARLSMPLPRTSERFISPS